ncbi:hypothetical protein ACHQM5_012004 [Ranunculus cassubicifolius]
MRIFGLKQCLSPTPFLFFLLAVSFQGHALITLPKNVTIPAVLAFGDSIIDPGNNNGFLTPGKANYPPYGRDFIGGNPSGRFSNGKIPTDLLAEQLGIKELLPAYLDPNLKPSDLPTGVCFASGGAGYDPVTSQSATAIPVSDQLKLFKEYIGKLTTYVGEAATASILSDSVYVAVFGSDDIANTYFGASVRRYHYDVNGYTDFMVQNALAFLQELYNLGARRMLVFSVPPIGCVPSQRTVQGGISRECVEEQNSAAIMFNSKLNSVIDGFNNKFEGGKVVYADIYYSLLNIIRNPHPYGFQVVNKGCCGTGLIEVTALCNSLVKLCQSVSDYIFWDSFHPTQKAYETLLYSLEQKLFDTMFYGH